MLIMVEKRTSTGSRLTNPSTSLILYASPDMAKYSVLIR